jgi:alkaline phosphatase D
MRSRELLLISLLGAAACSGFDGRTTGEVDTTTEGGPNADFPQGVASGDVTSTSAILWTRTNRQASVAVEIFDDAECRAAHMVRREIRTSAASDFTTKVTVEGLEPDHTYFYRFRLEAALSPTGTFRTAPKDDVVRNVRFAWTSDTDGSAAFNSFEVLDRMREDALDFWVYLGDTAYMDMARPFGIDLASMRAKYKQNRSYEALRNLLQSTSTYAIWDDHEIADDWDRETVDAGLFAAGLRAFSEYLPIREPGELGFFRTFRWGKDLELLVLDERTFRTAEVAKACLNDPAPTLPPDVRSSFGLPPTPPSGCIEALADPSRSLLGSAQKKALEQALTASDATWKVIVNEVTMTQAYFFPYDRWEGYAAERAELLDFIRGTGLTNVVFITGDLHANAVGNVRQEPQDPTPITKEFIAGPAAQRTLFESMVAAYGSDAAIQALQFLSGSGAVACLHADTFAYGLAELDAATKALSITLKGIDGEILCTMTMPSAL